MRAQETAKVLARRKKERRPPQRQRAVALTGEILAQWRAGLSIAAIARKYGLSRAVVSWLLEREGVRDEVADPRAHVRTTRKAKVLEWVRDNPGNTTMEAAAALGMNHRTVASYLVGEPEQKLIVERRSRNRGHTRDSMLEHIRLAYRSAPEDRIKGGLSKGLYVAYAAQDAPSTALYEKRFGTWREACIEAGVPSPVSHRTYRKTYSEEALLDAIEAYMEETDKTSFAGYSEWARERVGIVPSGPLVINRFGRWSAARRRLLDRRRARAA